MLIETNYRLWADYTREKEPEKIKAEVLARARYEHMVELQRYIVPGKKSPVLRVQTLEEEWRTVAEHMYPSKPNGGHIAKEYANSLYGWGSGRGDTYLILRTWVSYAYPLSCPVNGDVLDMDFITTFPDTQPETYFEISYPKPMYFRPEWFRPGAYGSDIPIKSWRRMQ